MSEAQKIIGACVKAMREMRGLSQDTLSLKAGISYQYLSGIETGKENFTMQVLEGLANALELPVRTLVVAAYEGPAAAKFPRVIPDYFRQQTPLPPGLTIDHIEAAVNHTQSIIHRINRNMVVEVGQTLQSLIQGNNFSGLVSNILCNAMDQCTPYKHNHHQRYPDLVYANPANGESEGLEVKTTINIGKGGESHNGHSGWHLIACYNFLPDGDIIFVHLMFANLVGHMGGENSDWSYVGSKANEITGSRRTETYTTNGQGTTKLRDGSVYMDPTVVSFKKWRQKRTGEIPPWSIYAPTLI